MGVGAAAIAGSLLVVRFAGKAPSPPLTERGLSEARARWSAAGAQNYSLTVVVKGREPAVHVVEVRAGTAHLTTDGRAQPDRLASYWTVEGMFLTLEEDLANRSAPSAAFGVPDPRDVFLDAVFDPVNGVPKRYLRQVKERPLTVEWEVRDFHATLAAPRFRR